MSEVYKSKREVSQEGSNITQPLAEPWGHLAFQQGLTPLTVHFCHRLSREACLLVRHTKAGLATMGMPSLSQGRDTKEANTCLCPLSKMRERGSSSSRASLQPQCFVGGEHNSRGLAKPGWHLSNYINESELQNLILDGGFRTIILSYCPTWLGTLLLGSRTA